MPLFCAMTSKNTLHSLPPVFVSFIVTATLAPTGGHAWRGPGAGRNGADPSAYRSPYHVAPLDFVSEFERRPSDNHQPYMKCFRKLALSPPCGTFIIPPNSEFRVSFAVNVTNSFAGLFVDHISQQGFIC